jgi:hypothetical protein
MNGVRSARLDEDACSRLGSTVKKATTQLDDQSRPYARFDVAAGGVQRQSATAAQRGRLPRILRPSREVVESCRALVWWLVMFGSVGNIVVFCLTLSGWCWETGRARSLVGVWAAGVWVGLGLLVEVCWVALGLLCCC